MTCFRKTGTGPKAPQAAGRRHGGCPPGATLTQRLLAFARKQELKAQATELKGLVEDMRDLLARSVGPLIRIEIESDGELPAVTVDRNQLEMALLNLAVNARDAMPSGGVLTLNLTSQDVAPDRQLGLPAGRFVVLAVSDTGEGMDEETLAKAVEPFFSTKAVGKGTGLGLSMVFGLAKQSGGALSLDSTPGAGTTARLWLPLLVKPGCNPKSRRLSGPKRRSGLKSF